MFKENDLVKSKVSSEIYTVQKVSDYVVLSNGGRYLEEELREATKEDLYQELESKVRVWVNREFNSIPLRLVEALVENEGQNLSEFIHPLDCLDIKESIENISSQLEDDDFSEEDREYLEEELQTLNEKLDSLNDDNYPLHGTLFELNSTDEDIIEAAKKIGLGVISGNDYFNSMLFMTETGSNFYRKFWIPLFLELYPDTRYDGIEIG